MGPRLARVTLAAVLALSILTVSVQVEIRPSVSCDECQFSRDSDITHLGTSQIVNFNEILDGNVVRTKRQITYPTFEYLKPSGVRMHITAPFGWKGTGYTVKTHVNINLPLNGDKLGQYNGEAITAGSSQFHWDIPDIKLRKGDFIHYYVEFIDDKPSGRRSQAIYGTNPVNELSDGSLTIVHDILPSPTAVDTRTSFIYPTEPEPFDPLVPHRADEEKNPTFEFFSPGGFRVHVPVPDGFSPANQQLKFHIGINQRISGEIGQYNGEVTSTKGSGEWFWDLPINIRLKRGDTIYYLVEVIEERRTIGGKTTRRLKYTGSWPINERDPHIGKSPNGPAATTPYTYTPTITMPTVTRPPVFTPPTATSIRPTATRPTYTRPTATASPLALANQPQLPPNCRQLSKTTYKGESVCEWSIINAAKPFFKVAKLPLDRDHEESFTMFSINGNHIENQGSTTVYRLSLTEEENVGGVDGSVTLQGCNPPDKCRETAHGLYILPPVIGGREITRDTFSFRYGTLQVSAKLPKGDWIVPELWLLPKDNVYGNNSGRIVLAMARGNENLSDKNGFDYSSKRLEAGVQIGDKEYMFPYPGKEPWNERYHTYRMTWTPDEIKFYVDGYEFGHVAPPQGGLNPSLGGTDLAPFDQEFYLVLGIHAGGDKGFPDTLNSKPWENLDPKSRVLFWKDRRSWYPTWSKEESGLTVERIDLIAL